MEHLRQFTSEGGAVLLVTHDRAAAQRADAIIYMDDGQIKTESGAGDFQ